MIQYTGRADSCKLTIIVMGDGVTKSLDVDVSKPPYNLNFTNKSPTKVMAFASSPVVPASGPPSEAFTSSTDAQLNLKSVELVANDLKIAFNHAPPKIGSTIGSPMPRTRLDVYFIYEPAAATVDIFVGVFTATVADDRILIPSHGLLNGNQIKFVLDDPTTGALPTPLGEVAYYFVVGARGNDFMVSSTSGGPVINLTDKGIGSNEVWKKNV